MKKKSEKKFLTAIEAAEYLGMCRLSLYRLVSANKIQAYKPSPKKLLFLADDLDSYVLSFSTAKMKRS
jgi:DNA binding domain, excisionase family